MKDRMLQAYHDGELGPLGRLRVRRRLARDAGARREIERLSEIGKLLREGAGEAPGPDLPDVWEAVRARLPARRPAPVPEAWPGLAWLRVAAPAAAAVAAVALVWTFLGQPAEAGPEGSLRWLHTGERSAVVLQDDRKATIIWVLDAPPGSSGRVSDGRRV